MIRKLCQDRSGVAAAEFAIGAPMILFSLVIMADLGIAMNERMNLDEAARAGAEFVMNNVDDPDELKTLVTAAATGNFPEDPGDVLTAEAPTVTVSNWCECPEAPGAPVACSGTLCSNDHPPSAYYELALAKTHDAIFLPDMSLNTRIQVQTR